MFIPGVGNFNSIWNLRSHLYDLGGYRCWQVVNVNSQDEWALKKMDMGGMRKVRDKIIFIPVDSVGYMMPDAQYEVDLDHGVIYVGPNVGAIYGLCNSH